MTSKQQNNPLYEELLHAVEHFEHVLPAQATIRDFVHHNTLHGFETLKFQDALKASHDLTGAYGYWPQEKFRQSYLKGRINNDDIHAVLAKDSDLNANKAISDEVFCRDIYRVASLFPLKKISSCQLKWQSEEAHAFESFQHDVSNDSREKLLKSAKSDNYKINEKDAEKEAIEDLWAACIDVLALDPVLLHPEELMNLDSEQAEKIYLNISSREDISSQKDAALDDKSEAILAQQHAWEELARLTQTNKQKNSQFNLLNLIKTLTGVEVKPSIISPAQSKIDAFICKQSWRQQEKLLSKVGDELTLRGFFKILTGVDVQEEITPYLLPYLSNWLDEGFAQWHANPESVKGFYQSWKTSAVVDEVGIFSDIPDWKEHIESLPDNALDTVVAELQRMAIPKNNWGSYITRLALDLPGWSGMFYWRHGNPEYKTPLQKNHKDQDQDQAMDVMDYLAVRLVLEHLHVRKLCRKLWLVEANLATIRGYLHREHAEFYVRYALYNHHLPEYLMNPARQLVDEMADRDAPKSHFVEWQLLANMIWTWQQSPSADSSLALQPDDEMNGHRGAHLHHDGWILFRLVQHLGLSATDVRQLNESQLDIIFECIEAMNKEKSGFILLQAYERHYRNKVFSVVAQNQGRGTWASRKEQRPEAQIIFCMDDREEGFRRHLEHANPAIETFGAAAFFGVVMNWKGINEDDSVVLCPVVVTPVHEIQEHAAPDHLEDIEQFQNRTKIRTQLREFIHQDSHRSLLTTSFLTALYLPATLMTLLGKSFVPLNWNQWASNLKQKFDSPSITRIKTTASNDESAIVTNPPTPKNRQLGYSIEEQTNIVESFLQNNGLLMGLSPLIVLMGHYSRNQNNPHAAAYGCGACGGKFSGPNGRVFAAMANHPEVRSALVKRDLIIPQDTWFIGAEHDTCNEDILWEDTDLIPASLQEQFSQLKKEMSNVCRFSAHERCRKLASAPREPSKSSAIKHIAGRAVDFSQARPELGHATIAVGFVGRRYLSQGTFMDRRCFLISYDSNVDPEGAFLERILLSAGPVGAGINLEYYFSSVNNERYGCGSKIVHNLSGLFGVMEGGCGDLRTGLPLQMIEIHEPMRLQLMVEATTETLTMIYKRQPSIQQLVGNGWLLLSAKNPETAEIHTFDPDRGWELWEDSNVSDVSVTTVKNSQQWYQGHTDHLSPVLVEKSSKLNKEHKDYKEYSEVNRV